MQEANIKIQFFLSFLPLVSTHNYLCKKNLVYTITELVYSYSVACGISVGMVLLVKGC